MASYRTFWQEFFHASMYCKVETRVLCVHLKSICVQVHAQTKWPTAFEISYRDIGDGFWVDLEAIFFLIHIDFFRIILKNIFLDLNANYSFIAWIFTSWSSKYTAPEFSIEILKTDFEKALKQFFQNSFQIIHKDSLKFRIFVWVANHVKIYHLSRNLDMFLQ